MSERDELIECLRVCGACHGCGIGADGDTCTNCGDERQLNRLAASLLERDGAELERLTAERDGPRNRCPQCDQLRLELGEAESLRAENERLKIEAARHETEMGEVIDERDEMESALSAAHVALGGDGEWACRVPSPPPPDSGNLSLDVPVLAAQVLARAEAAEKAIERVLPAKAREHIDCWKVNYGLDRYDKVTAARRWAEAGGPSDGPIMALATAIEWLEST